MSNFVARRVADGVTIVTRCDQRFLIISDRFEPVMFPNYDAEDLVARLRSQANEIEAMIERDKAGQP